MIKALLPGLLFFSAALFPLTAAGQTVEGETAAFHFLLRRDNPDRYLHLQIGPHFLGRLYRGRWKTFRVRSGASIPITIFGLDTRLAFTVTPDPGSVWTISTGLSASGKPASAGPAGLLLSGTRGAKVQINGRDLADTVRLIPVPAGRCTITVRRGKQVFLWVGALTGGQRQRVKAVFR